MNDRPEGASIDLTLLFGAESYLLQVDDADPNADPWRIHAFRRFIDVLLSGVEVYFPLPQEPDRVTRLVSSRLARSVSFGQFRLCATPLNAKTEEAVVRGFSTFLEHPQKRLDLAKWLRFQMHPSRVEGD